MERCENCTNTESVVCWAGGVRNIWCKSCLVRNLNENGGVKVVCSTQDGWDEVLDIKNIEDFRGILMKRLDRLGFLKEKNLLELHMAREELKRLVDKEVNRIIKEFHIACEESEKDLKLLIQSIKSNETSVKIVNKNLLSAEPIEFELVSEPVISALSGLVKYRIKNLEETREKLPFFNEKNLNLFVPEDKKINTLGTAKFKHFEKQGVCFVPNDWIYLAGGFKKTSVNKCKKFRINKSKIFDLEDMNEPRDSFAMFYFDEFIYAFGGKTDGKVLDSCEKYSLRTKQWVSICRMNEGKFDLSIADVGNFVFVCGIGSRFVEKFDTRIEKFEQLEVQKNVDQFIRILPSFGLQIVLFGAGKVQFVDGGNGRVVEEEDFEGGERGESKCVVYQNWVYFEADKRIWKFNRVSSRIMKHLE